MLHYLNMSFAESPASQCTVTSVWKEQVFNLNLFVHWSRPLKLAQMTLQPKRHVKKESKPFCFFILIFCGNQSNFDKHFNNASCYHC